MSNAYIELKQKHEQEVNNFPIAFAFSDKQFKEGMEKLGLTENDTDKVVSIGMGGFIRKTDKEKYKDMLIRHREEREEAIYNDSTGEGYIFEMFKYELANHEYGYTREVEDTLDALGLTIDEVKADERLSKALDKACKTVA